MMWTGGPGAVKEGSICVIPWLMGVIKDGIYQLKHEVR